MRPPKKYRRIVNQARHALRTKYGKPYFFYGMRLFTTSAGRIRAELGTCMILLLLLLAGCGTSHHHDDAQPAPQTQKTTDDGPAVERVVPPCDDEHHHEHESEAL